MGEHSSVQNQTPHSPQEADEHLLREGWPGSSDYPVFVRWDPHQRKRHAQIPGHGGRRHNRGVPAAEWGGGPQWRGTGHSSQLEWGPRSSPTV